MRDRLRRAERRAEELGGYVRIPQKDGPPKQFPQAAVLEAFKTAVQRLCGEDVPEHPLSTAAANSPDPDWYNCFVAGTHTVTGDAPVEDLSEF